MHESNMKDAASAAPAVVGPEERQWAMFAHLSALLVGLITSGWAGSIGFFIGPLVLVIIAAMKANESIAHRHPFALRLVK